MNKKKKQSRLKHRKNKERMRNLLQASRLKAKPKKAEITPEKEAPIQNMVEEVAKPEPVKKAAKPAKQKTAAKKPLPRKILQRKNQQRKLLLKRKLFQRNQLPRKSLNKF